MATLPQVTPPTLLALTLLSLAGCGGATTTVTVSSAPSPTHTARQTSTAPASTSSTASSPPSPSGGEGQTGTSNTRTAPAPKFAQGESTAGGLSGAVAVVKAHGYTPNDTAEYDASHTLRVLLATKTGSADGYDQRAFFFLDGHYLGTDASSPSAGVKVLDQGDTEVTLAYPLYRSSDPLCCPGAGQATVHFQLNNGRLVALDPIPPVEPTSGDGRR